MRRSIALAVGLLSVLGRCAPALAQVAPLTSSVSSLTASSGGSGSGDIDSVAITASSPLTGTATCTTGACSFTLGLGTVTVAKGGTGLTAGTDGGILGYTATGTLASSIALTLHALLVGGGAGATPTPLGSLGTSTQVLHGAAAGDPTWGAIVNADITNATIDLTTKVTGALPYGNGGTGATSFTSNGVVVAGASALSTVAPGTSGNVLTSNGTAWTSAAAAGGGGNPFDDGTAIIKGSADATKLLRFEVDGFTTATTRVLTPQNRDGTVADLGSNTFTAVQVLPGTGTNGVAFGGTASTNPTLRQLAAVAATPVLGVYNGNTSGYSIIDAKSLQVEGGNRIADQAGVMTVVTSAGSANAPFRTTNLQCYTQGNGNLVNFSQIGDLNVAAVGNGTVGNGSAFLVTGGNSRVAADVTNATTTMAAVTGLTATVLAGRHYTGKMVLYVADSTAADGIKIDYDSSTATMTAFRSHCTITDTALLTSSQTSALATDVTSATMTGDALVECQVGFTVNAGGTFAPRAAQNAHTTGTLTVYRESYMQLTDTL